MTTLAKAGGGILAALAALAAILTFAITFWPVSDRYSVQLQQGSYAYRTLSIFASNEAGRGQPNRHIGCRPTRGAFMGGESTVYVTFLLPDDQPRQLTDQQQQFEFQVNLNFDAPTAAPLDGALSCVWFFDVRGDAAERFRFELIHLESRRRPGTIMFILTDQFVEEMTFDDFVALRADADHSIFGVDHSPSDD
ncbi:hypothetical protein [Jannaschia sp. M317]|uniref:hypothetical protein n=1 Tax=Jannaschia sp. M317 TaxID=2867011 RepID=UPI0021A653C2|nr:hypothetical protein [Jannaschia sp. M317]UWQ18903.1 hypothetical protein K3551_06370 [Jannaschia sp. M317]